MKKVTLTYGLIAGAITAALMFITMPLLESGTLNYGELVGYTGMVIALSMIFFGIKSYRDNYGSGSVSFWKGCQIGLLISIIAAVMYGLAWEVCYHTISTEFAQGMMDSYVNNLKASGASQEKVDEAMSFSAMYKDNFFVRFGMTMTEILPVGIILTLLSAGLLRKKEFLQSDPVQ